MPHKLSIEKLYHFNCSQCAKWWSIGDWSVQKELTCPHCGFKDEVLMSSDITVNIDFEAGYQFALKGLAKSYFKRDKPFDEYFTECKEKMQLLALKLNEQAHREGNFSHAKILRQITLGLTIRASRDFWSQFDTYTVGVVRQSESTMHTLGKRLLTADDFHSDVEQTAIDCVNRLIESKADRMKIKKNLPEGFLQERGVVMNYASLQNMITQRKNHKLGEWKAFVEQIKIQIEHPEILIF